MLLRQNLYEQTTKFYLEHRALFCYSEETWAQAKFFATIGMIFIYHES